MVRISSRQLFGAIKKLKYRKVKFWLRQQKHNKRQQKHNQKLKLPFVRIVKKTDTKILRNYLLLKTYDKCYAMVGYLCIQSIYLCKQ